MSTAKEALQLDKWSQLLEPFPMEMIELRPGATNKDKSKALALAYCDKRIYESRLDALFGPDGWAVSYEAWGNDKVFCHLTIAGITKCDVGECDQKDTNAATIAVAQAFKRACSTFGLGRFLYSLPQVWAAFDGYKFTEPEKAVAEMYRRGGIGPHSKQERQAPLRSPAAPDEQREPPARKPAQGESTIILDSQIYAITNIGKKKNIDVHAYAMKEYGKPVTALSGEQAAEMIRYLNGVKA